MSPQSPRSVRSTAAGLIPIWDAVSEIFGKSRCTYSSQCWTPHLNSCPITPVCVKSRLEDIIFLTLFYSEFLTISFVILLISIMLAIILTIPIIMLMRYSIPANSATLEWNKYQKNSRPNQTQSWNAKRSHSLCTSKGFNSCTVATIESGIAAITITSSQLHVL